AYINHLDDYMKEKVFNHVSNGITFAKLEEQIYKDYQHPNKKVYYMARMVLMKDRLDKALARLPHDEKESMTGPLLATIHWLNGDPIPKRCAELARASGLKESYLHQCYLTVAKGPVARGSRKILSEAREPL